MFECDVEGNSATKCEIFSPGTNLGNYVIEREGGPIPLKTAKTDDTNIIYWDKKDDKQNEFIKTSQYNSEKSFYHIVSADKLGDKKHAYAVFDEPLKKAFGYKTWEELSSKKTKIYYRYGGGGVGDLIEDENAVANFEPSSRDADDGALIDLSNQARAKGTIVGTAAGGALGGFAGYQGAQTEVSERWVSALREYEDSLSNFVCFTGGRFLSKYNDYADIPALKTNK